MAEKIMKWCFTIIIAIITLTMVTCVGLTTYGIITDHANENTQTQHLQEFEQEDQHTD